MLSFRQKIILVYLGLFLLFVLLLFPITSHLIDTVEEGNLRKETQALIKKIDAGSMDEVIANLKKEQKHLFYRVTLLDSLGAIIYDTYYGSHLPQEELKNQTEVTNALQNSSGYAKRQSAEFGQELAYMALPFYVGGKKVILRTAFPYGQIESITDDFTLAFVIVSTAILLLFGLMTWLIISYLTSPVQQIIRAIKPYQEGKIEHLPEIKLKNPTSKNEFQSLAETLNSLTQRIEQQIEHLRQERNDKEAILDSLGEGVVAVDQMMTVVYMNKVSEQLLKVDKEQLIGKSFALAKQPKCHHLLHEALQKQQVVTGVLKPDGKPKLYLDIISVPRDQKQGAILVLQDKSGLHKVLELGRNFIANSSHELKTPITIIRGFAETLYDHPELSKEVSREITEKIVSNCQRMDTLVKNLLTLADIDEGLPRSRLIECDLFELIQHCKQIILTVHPKADIQLEQRNKEPVDMMVDSDLFELAIMNLLDNAVKYSPAPAQVKVILEKKGSEVIIQVTDKGMGIPQEDLEHIFERFYTVNKAHSRSLGGSGLGLSIVERIVEKHSGKITVQSTMGSGTTFTIVLPILEDERY